MLDQIAQELIEKFEQLKAEWSYQMSKFEVYADDYHNSHNHFFANRAAELGNAAWRTAKAIEAEGWKIVADLAELGYELI